MKCISILLLGILFTGCAKQYVTVYPQMNVNYFRRMAVLPFASKTDGGSDLANGVETNLVNHVPQLDLVERQQIQMITKEWNLVRQGIVSDQTAVNIGRLVGARVIMTGQIKDCSIIRRGNNGGGVMYGSLRASVRIVDVETGQLKWAKEFEITYPGVWGRCQAYFDYTGESEFKAKMISIASDSIAKEFYVYEKEM